MTTEMCPHCDTEVKIPPYLGIYKCPNCGKLIVSCSMCRTQNCTNCEYLIKEQLQAEKEKSKHLEDCLNQALKDFEVELDKAVKYKQALEEIKEIAEDFENCYGSDYAHIKQILQECEVMNDV